MRLGQGGKRIVITGMGCFSPLGSTPELYFKSRLNAQSSVKRLPSSLSPDPLIASYFQQDLSPFYTLLPFAKNLQNLTGFYSALKAVEDSGFSPKTLSERQRFGSVMGLSTTSEAEMEQACSAFLSTIGSVDSSYYDDTSLHSLSKCVSSHFKLQGPVASQSSLCATGGLTIMQAARFILSDEADIMIAGASEIGSSVIKLKGFLKLQATYSNSKEPAEESARPLDESRKGFIHGDGGAALIVEELNHALRRGAKIYAELVGFSQKNESYNLVAPTPEGDGMFRAMKAAITMAGLKPEDVDLIHSHTTGTNDGDIAEMKAVKKLFADKRPYITAHKGNIGHTLSASGIFNSIDVIMSINQHKVPPIANLKNPIKINGEVFNYVMHVVDADVKYALANSIGLGGHNNSVAYGRYKE